jgi:hypothetical protein
MRILAALAFAGLAACGSVPHLGVTKSSGNLDAIDLGGPVLQFRPMPGLPSQRSNQQLAQDFLDLEFRLESGLALPVLTRFEGPVTLSMTGAIPPTARSDLAALIARLKAEAGLNLTLLPDNSPAVITLDFEPNATLHRIEPTAACFVVPNVSSLAEYRAKRGSEDLDWAQMRVRSRATLFLPADTSPQEVRDCLHEETAQALGPVNDLYRLPDSVFNDDNFQSVLTGFDMLMLRLHYAPELASGMGEAEVAAKLPALLARLNPAGQKPGGWLAADTPRLWLDAVALAVNPAARPPARLEAANRSLAIALEAGWQDNRLGFAYFILGRLQAPRDPHAAKDAYEAAARIYETLPDEGVHLAHALMQLSAIALAGGQDAQAMALADRALPLALTSQNAALMATLKLIKAEALAALGHDAEAAALRLDSLPAARYGFGAEPEVRAHAAEIAAIALLDHKG